MTPGATVLVVMGVSGAGKTTVGEALSRRLDWTFQEGDDLHPAANVAKMASGAPLDDADRAPWLAGVEAWISGELAAGRSGVIACSALKRAYRTAIGAGRDDVILVCLDGGYASSPSASGRAGATLCRRAFSPASSPRGSFPVPRNIRSSWTSASRSPSRSRTW